MTLDAGAAIQRSLDGQRWKDMVRLAGGWALLLSGGSDPPLIEPVVLCPGSGQIVASAVRPDPDEWPRCPSCGGQVAPQQSPYMQVPDHLPATR